MKIIKKFLTFLGFRKSIVAKQKELARLMKVGYASGVMEGKYYYSGFDTSACPLSAAGIGKLGRDKMDGRSLLFSEGLAIVLNIPKSLAENISITHYSGKMSATEIIHELEQGLF